MGNLLCKMARQFPKGGALARVGDLNNWGRTRTANIILHQIPVRIAELQGNLGAF